MTSKKGLKAYHHLMISLFLFPLHREKMKFVYVRHNQKDKHEMKLLSENEEVIGYLVFVIPSEQTFEEVKKTNSAKFAKWWLDEYKEKPYIDYSFIEPKFRSKGYGKALYKAVSVFLKTEYGFKLYSSRNQSKEIKLLWSSLRKESDPRFIATDEYLEAV